MTPDARASAAIGVLDQVLAGAAAERALLGWARHSRFAGSKDRAAVRDIVFDCLRCQHSYAALGGAQTGRALVLGRCREARADVDALFSGGRFGPPPLSAAERAYLAAPVELDPLVAIDCPAWLAGALREALGRDFGAVMAAQRHRAPMFLRVNIRRVAVPQVIKSLADEGVIARPHPLSKTALEVTENARRTVLTQAYLHGLVEIQGVASQAAVDLLPTELSRRILDFCAGGGGKTLAMAARATARITAYDANSARMADLPARAARAGVAVRIATSLRALERQSFDLVVCDAPCSGSGTWARSPEAKWRLDAARLAELVHRQAEILDAAAPLVANGGRLAYLTCSLLREENHDQAVAFVARNAGWHLAMERQISPLESGDGFFAALLSRD